MEFGWPYPKRKRFLQDIQSQDTTKSHPILFQNKLDYLPIRSVPIELPLYRLENGRTMDRQAEHLAIHSELPTTFFRADLESADAQIAQHKILTELAREGKNLFAEFKTEKQSEPLVLSAQGVVINGNRRLSTWRHLLDDDFKAYKHFSNIDVVILPLCDERDLDDLEATLQLKEDLKAEYSWTSQALMFKEKRDKYNYTEAQLAAKYDIDPQELKELFDSLDYADAYLESRGTPHRYSSLDGKKFAFIQIARTRKRLKVAEPFKEIFEKASFCLADESGEGKRTYAEIKVVGDLIEKVASDLTDELNIKEDGEVDTALAALADALFDPENFETARLAIRETLDAEGAKKKQKKKADFVAEQVRRSREALEAARDGIDSNASRSGVERNLQQIALLVETLTAWAKGDD